MTVDNRTGIILTLGNDMSNPVIDSMGNKRRYNADGQYHRLDGPAYEGVKGDKAWYQKGDKVWYQNGKLHRLDGPAIEYTDGSKAWYVNGQLHRLDGPAVEWANGTKSWYVNGQCHRLGGPAVEWANGYEEWYLYGKELTEAGHYAQTCVYQFIMSKPYPVTVETAP